MPVRTLKWHLTYLNKGLRLTIHCELPEAVSRHGALRRTAPAEGQSSDRELADKNALLNAALEHVDQGILMVDACGYVVVCNQRAIELLELPSDLMSSGPHFDDVKKWQMERGEFAKVDAALLYRIKNEGIHVEASVYERRRPNGLELEIRTNSLPGGGVVRTYTDISARKAVEKELWRSANHDPLTGLANRALFQKSLEDALRDAEAAGTCVDLLLLDLDDFKDVNDSFGHAAGDSLLTETAARLKRLTIASDTVARVGGDEFAIIRSGRFSLPDTAAFANVVVTALQTAVEYDGRALPSGVSVGVASFPEHDRDSVELVKDADIALYRAKEEGRGRAVVYTNVARQAMEHRVAIRRGVRNGLGEGEFLPHYQPKISLATGQIAGFEALARWQHPTKGLLTPGYFGSVFEDPDISVALGENIIRQVAADIRKWLDQGLNCGRVAVNLASADFSDPRLATRIVDILDDARVPTSHFEIEVTETVFLGRKPEGAAFILSEFHEAGVSIALDDFGTGFASLTHLKQFPVDHIKIDQSFVKNLESDHSDAAIVGAIVSLGRNMGMHITAEGVENAGQAKRLREAGCDFGQGFLYAKPCPGDHVPGVIRSWSPPEELGLRQSPKRLIQPH